MKPLVWTTVTTVILTIGLAVTNKLTEAHHSSAPFYDDSKEVQADGVVSEFVFRNPHSFLYVNVENEDGQTIQWEIEMGPAVMMGRRGWTPETIKPGDRLKVVGRPSRAPGTHGMCCAELTKPDGSPIRP